VGEMASMNEVYAGTSPCQQSKQMHDSRISEASSDPRKSSVTLTIFPLDFWTLLRKFPYY
jgi:hypothetical protein